MYDTDGVGISGATVRGSNISGSETTTTTATTTTSGYYQINVQDISDEGDLIQVQFTSGAIITQEFVRVDLDILTQEVNATLQNQFSLITDTYNLYLPLPMWGAPNKKLTKDITLFNFKTFAIEVVDKGINSEPTNLQGHFVVGVYTRNTISGKYEILVDIMNNNKKITISGINDYLDGIFVIKSWKLRSIPGSPKGFIWVLALEYVGGIE